nr:hypothetical protein [Bacteroidota bacterium]
MVALNFVEKGWSVKDRSKSSKLDYSKRSIREFLKSSFALTGQDLTDKVNYIYDRLTVKHRGNLNKEISLNMESSLNKIVINEKKLISKGYIKN